MKIKTNELTAAQLNWAVAQCEERKDPYWMNHSVWGTYSPSTNWALAGPIIEREKIAIDYSGEGNGWCASHDSDARPFSGESPLEAAMRCYVASKLGDIVEIPEELL